MKDYIAELITASANLASYANDRALDYSQNKAKLALDLVRLAHDAIGVHGEDRRVEDRRIKARE